MLPPYLVKLVTFDVIQILLIFSGKVTTQLRCGGNIFSIKICMQVLPDHNSEIITDIGVAYKVVAKTV